MSVRHLRRGLEYFLLREVEFLDGLLPVPTLLHCADLELAFPVWPNIVVKHCECEHQMTADIPHAIKVCLVCWALVIIPSYTVCCGPCSSNISFHLRSSAAILVLSGMYPAITIPFFQECEGYCLESSPRRVWRKPPTRFLFCRRFSFPQAGGHFSFRNPAIHGCGPSCWDFNIPS